jgi:WD40 repeat protein
LLGRIIASGSYGDIKLWDASMVREIYTLKGHSDWVRSVAFSPDGKILASGSNDKTINIWQLASLSNTATSSPIKPTQSNVHQPATSTPQTPALVIQPSATSTITTTSSSVQPTQSQISQSSIGMVVLWLYFVFLFIILCFLSVVSGFVGGFLVGVIGIGCCWRFYRWFWRFS